MTEPLNYEGPTSAQVVENVRKFLETPIRADGDGWPPVTTEDLHEVWDLFHNILEAKYERDCDGDMVMEVEMNRRNRGNMVALRTTHRRNGPVDLAEAMRDIQYITDVAAGMVKQIAGPIQLHEQERQASEAWREKCQNITDFCRAYEEVSQPGNKSEQIMLRRLRSWVEDRRSGLYEGHEDEVWAPLGLTCVDLRNAAGDARQKPDDLFDLVDGAAREWLA